ncbi:imelysin family protein [Gemmobacter serpentinus]|uniref:imelysin family protein n=1 Tax=Gemmobacter serpentinus TaxID=2652247 RepID=UPI00124E5CF2|nr:imelysin family protein [Gemmobacter serpentinus]
MKPLLVSLCLAATFALPARADVAEAVQDHILPGYARFTEATRALADIDSCAGDTLRDGWNAAYDAWIGVAHLRLGPVEDDGRVLAIAFWPDPKGIGAKQTAAAFRKADPALLTPEQIAEQSVAFRGLTGMERLIYADTPPEGYACDLALALADDLARMAAEVEAGWRSGFAQALTHPGKDGRYHSEAEARQAMLTALVTGVEFNADTRIGRPLATFDIPRPERVESRLSGRTMRNIALSLAATRDLAQTLYAKDSLTDAAFAKAEAMVPRVDLAQVADPQQWLKAEILAQSIHAIRDAAMAEIAPALGTGIGFNAADGD